ncbi:OLC1v1028924C1 [Oldenlandia corymbosa var. corymbosa]|uniref:OLC1v1028924C1 n=1 Tax=Oldenlandia corymbosa var. corymbosa TaxID=529605 RepID=A0AAV1CCV1_OLDCO|nr:OLC1v1028924C1 [Oldenlandia corymbosa var. corymbosa]
MADRMKRLRKELRKLKRPGRRGRTAPGPLHAPARFSLAGRGELHRHQTTPPRGEDVEVLMIRTQLDAMIESNGSHLYIPLIVCRGCWDTRLDDVIFQLSRMKCGKGIKVLCRHPACRVGRQVVNVPSFMVRVDSQKHIDFSLTSPFGGGRAGRVKRKNQKAAAKKAAGGDATRLPKRLHPHSEFPLRDLVAKHMNGQHWPLPICELYGQQPQPCLGVLECASSVSRSSLLKALDRILSALKALGLTVPVLHPQKCYIVWVPCMCDAPSEAVVKGDKPTAKLFLQSAFMDWNMPYAAALHEMISDPTCSVKMMKVPLQLFHSELPPMVVEIFLPPELNCDGDSKGLLKSLLSTMAEELSVHNADFGLRQNEEFSVESSRSDADSFLYSVHRRAMAGNKNSSPNGCPPNIQVKAENPENPLSATSRTTTGLDHVTGVVGLPLKRKCEEETWPLLKRNQVDHMPSNPSLSSACVKNDGSAAKSAPGKCKG